jgi:hypothetical protein
MSETSLDVSVVHGPFLDCINQVNYSHRVGDTWIVEAGNAGFLTRCLELKIFDCFIQRDSSAINQLQ